MAPDLLCTPGERPNENPAVQLHQCPGLAVAPGLQVLLQDKPVSVISSSKAFIGGVRAQYQLRETLISMYAQLVTGAEIVVGGIHRNFVDESYTDEAGLAFMMKSLNRLRDAALSSRLVPA
jgi:chromate reductase, NAD(P)H dehydrogenase (quinone)